ncbi:MAG: DedA family protein [Acidimicrobiales bacterium]
MSGIVDSLLHLHGIGALALLFALPALESSAFFGFIFPGETAAILGGVLSYEHRVHLSAAIAAVILGAIVGDTVGYAVGHRWGTRMLSGRLSRFIKPHHVDRARLALRRRGGWAVFFGRFTAALRVLIPGIAGTAGMPYKRFALFNVTGGAVWGACFVLVGFLAGAAWRTAAHTASIVGLAVLGVAAAAIVIGVLLWRRRREGALEGELAEADEAAPSA